MTALHSRLRLGVLLSAMLAAGACMTDTECDCAVPELGGTYVATRLRFTQTGQATVDALAAGASIRVTLVETDAISGTTTGTLVIPASVNSGVAETLDLIGTYQNASSGLMFIHAADTFIRDVPWSHGTNTLLTAATVGGVTYDVILTRQ